VNSAIIEQDVRKFIVELFLSGRSEELQDNAVLFGRVIDSMGALELVTFLQEHFAIIVDDEDVTPENFGSVKHVVAYVTSKVQSKPEFKADKPPIVNCEAPS
jgi:acyl carrier protein